jgi:hypothetical protein
LTAGMMELARATLSTVDRSKLDDAGELDFALINACFALESNSILAAADAKAELLARRMPPYFARQQLAFVKLLDEFILQKGKPLNDTATSVGLLALLSKFAELKPNIFGLGINFNAVIDAALKSGKDAHQGD